MDRNGTAYKRTSNVQHSEGGEGEEGGGVGGKGAKGDGGGVVDEGVEVGEASDETGGEGSDRQDDEPQHWKKMLLSNWGIILTCLAMVASLLFRQNASANILALLVGGEAAGGCCLCGQQ